MFSREKVLAMSFVLRTFCPVIREWSFIKVHPGRDKFWGHEIFTVYLGGYENSGFIWMGYENFWLYLGGLWKIPALFGWITKYFLKFWVGHEFIFEILGGSWNSPWNFGWVMKNFQTFENVSRPLWTIIYVRSLRSIQRIVTQLVV